MLDKEVGDTKENSRQSTILQSPDCLIDNDGNSNNIIEKTSPKAQTQYVVK